MNIIKKSMFLTGLFVVTTLKCMDQRPLSPRTKKSIEFQLQSIQTLLNGNVLPADFANLMPSVAPAIQRPEIREEIEEQSETPDNDDFSNNEPGGDVAEQAPQVPQFSRMPVIAPELQEPAIQNSPEVARRNRYDLRPLPARQNNQTNESIDGIKSAILKMIKLVQQGNTKKYTLLTNSLDQNFQQIEDAHKEIIHAYIIEKIRTAQFKAHRVTKHKGTVGININQDGLELGRYSYNNTPITNEGLVYNKLTNQFLNYMNEKLRLLAN